MKKFVSLLEQHVQWIALGLGAVYLLYMVYIYILQPPIGEKIGNTLVDLGNVDQVTAEGPAQRLRQAMDNQQPVAENQDKNWATSQFKLSMSSLGQAFRSARLPQAMNQTIFLRVELEREEQLPNGTWGNRTVIEPLAINQVPPFPAAGNVMMQ